MTPRALHWFEDDHRGDLGRWSAAATVVALAHGALIAGTLLWSQPPEPIGDNTPIISIDLIAPEIDQAEQAKVETPAPPQNVSSEAAIPVEKPPEEVEQSNPAPRTTVHAVESAPRIDPSWQSLLLKHLQRFKNYPPQARRRREQGVVLLAFSIDRDGHVLSRHIVKSSGSADLDAEAMALVERAQPMPAFAPSMTQTRLELTVPIRFSLR